MRPAGAIAKLVFLEIFRKKDFYVAFVLMAVILFYASRMEFYNVSNTVRYMREIGLSLIFLFSVFLTVPLAARQYPSEVQQRTLPVLFSKPVARWQFVMGKYIGSACAGAACFLLFYAVFTGFSCLGERPLSAAAAAQTALLFCFGLAVLSAMAVGLSFYLTQSANIALTLILYFLMNIYGAHLYVSAKALSLPARTLGQACYYLLPHFEFFDMRQRLIHEWGPIPLSLVLFLGAYAAVCSSVFLIAGWLKLKREVL